MKLPRDITGRELVKALRKLGYVETRTKGSHIRVTKMNGEHHEVVPNHNPVKCGTLSSILKSVAAHHRLSQEDLRKLLEL